MRNLNIILRHMTPLATASIAFLIGFVAWVIWKMWPDFLRALPSLILFTILILSLVRVICLIADVIMEWATKEEENDL